MRAAIRVLVVIDPSQPKGAVQQLVSEQPQLELVGIIEDSRGWDSRKDIAADLLIIACGAVTPDVLESVEEASADSHDRPVILLSTERPNGDVGRILAAGADDIVVFDGTAASGPDLVFAIQKAINRHTGPSRDEPAGGELICVLGPKGGTGKTLTTSNLAVALAEEGLRVCVVDLDLQFGDIGLVFGVSPERSIYDLVTTGGSMDASKLDAFLTSHDTGVSLLLAPARPDHAAAVTPAFLAELFPVMRQVFDVVLVDTPPGFTPEVITAIDAASWVCLIGTLDTPSLKNAKLGAETLELMGYPPERIRIVLNRADSSVGVTHSDVVTVLGRAPDVLVPSHREIVRSVNVGEPIVRANPRSEAAKAFTALARLFAVKPRAAARGGGAPDAADAPPQRIRRGMRALGRS